MITVDALVVTARDLDPEEIERWIDRDWVRPAGARGAWLFSEIDVARVHLIRDLRKDLDVQDDALPLVLRLMDQLYDERRRLRRIRDVVERAAPPEFRDALIEALRAAIGR